MESISEPYALVPLSYSDFLHPHATEIQVLFGDGVSYEMKQPVKVRIAQYLDDPTRTTPLSKETDFAKIAHRVRFSFGMPASNDDSLSRIVHLYDLMTSIDIAFVDDSLTLAPWDDRNPNPMFSLAIGSYPQWSKHIPALVGFSRMTFLSMFLYKKYLPSCTLVPSYDGIFTYAPTEFHGFSGRLIGLRAGSKNFFSFGLLHVEDAFWKLFWKTVIAKRPLLDRKCKWQLIVSHDLEPIGRLTLRLRYVLAKKPVVRMTDVTIGILWDEDCTMNLWSAIALLFSQVRKDAYAPNRSVDEGPYKLESDSTH